MTRFAPSLFVLMALSSTAVYAESPKSIKDYPDIITKAMSRSNFYEDTVSNVFRSADINEANNYLLSAETLKKKEAEYKQQKRTSQISQLLSMDNDNSGTVSKKEIEDSLVARSRGLNERYMERQLEQYNAYDKNQDGVIDFTEMRELSEQVTQGFERQLTPLRQLLEQDPNNDQKVTAGELREITSAAFKLVDSNGDLALSAEEKKAMQETLRPPRVSHPHFGNMPRTPKFSIPEGNELHVVGIYEGSERTNGQIHGPQAKIKVNRPGKKVSLLLTSYDRVLWMVEATDKTVIDQIIASSHDKTPSKVMVNGKERKIDVTLPRGSYGYERDNSRFRKLLDVIEAATGRGKVESFHGKYQASETPFIIETVDDDVNLRKERLEAIITPATELPKLRFSATLAGKSGEYDLSGKLLKSLHSTVASAITPNGKDFYTLDASSGLKKYDSKGNHIEDIPASIEVPSFSWATGLTYDSKRNRLVISSFGGKGYIYAYDLESKKWSVLSSFNDRHEVQRFSYDSVTDTYIGAPWRVAGKNLGLHVFSPQGEYMKSVEIPINTLPGFTDIYDDGNGSGPVVDIIPTEKYFIILESTGHSRGALHSNVQRVYLHSRETKSNKLTWASDSE